MWPGDWGDELGRQDTWVRVLIGCPCMLLVVIVGTLLVAAVCRDADE